jgi:LDH2 family malate/lactate/ureidoglycolate dehydrogenase
MFKVKYDDTKRRCKRKLKQRQNEELSAALAEKLFNGAHRGAEAIGEIQFFDFFILIFLYFSLILNH